MGVVAAQSALSFVRVGHTVGLITFRAAVTLRSRFGGRSVSSFSSLTPSDQEATSVAKAQRSDGTSSRLAFAQSFEAPLLLELEEANDEAGGVEMDSLLLPSGPSCEEGEHALNSSLRRSLSAISSANGEAASAAVAVSGGMRGDSLTCLEPTVALQTTVAANADDFPLLFEDPLLEEGSLLTPHRSGDSTVLFSNSIDDASDTLLHEFPRDSSGDVGYVTSGSVLAVEAVDGSSRDDCPPLCWFFDVDTMAYEHHEKSSQRQAAAHCDSEKPSHPNRPLSSLRFVPLPLVVFGDGTIIDTAPISSPPPPLTSTRRCPLAVTAILRGHPSVLHVGSESADSPLPLCAVSSRECGTAGRVSSMLAPIFTVDVAAPGGADFGDKRSHCDWCCSDCFVGRQQQHKRRVNARFRGDGVRPDNSTCLVSAAPRVTLVISDFPLSVAAWGWASADGRLEPETVPGEGVFVAGPFSALAAFADVIAALIVSPWRRLTCQRCWARRLGIPVSASSRNDAFRVGDGEGGVLLLGVDLPVDHAEDTSAPPPCYTYST